MPDLPGIRAEALDDRSRAVMLCPFRLCDWTSDDTRTMLPREQDAVAEAHLLDAHRDAVLQLARLAERIRWTGTHACRCDNPDAPDHLPAGGSFS